MQNCDVKLSGCYPNDSPPLRKLHQPQPCDAPHDLQKLSTKQSKYKGITNLQKLQNSQKLNFL